jgi:uncharacterized protein YggE
MPVLRSILVLLPALLASPCLPAVAGETPACDGTRMETRGSAERDRPAQRLRFSLGLTAEASSTDAALKELQRRLARVRTSLQTLAVEELRVTSPTTWERPAARGRPRTTQAQLQVSGALAPAQLQPLIRGMGALPGVRLQPVTPEADPEQDAAVRRELLRDAYGDALRQAREIAAVIGRNRLDPIELSVETGGPIPRPMRTMADAAPPPFDPEELPSPRQRLTMLVRFCAR